GVAYLYVDAPITILWTPTGTYPGSYRTDVQIHYSTDIGESYIDPDNRINEKANPATGVQGTQGWNVPNAISANGTDNVMIRVRVKNSPTAVEAESRAFLIVGSIETVDAPTAGEVWNAGDTNKLIQWTSKGTITNVNIDYATAAGGTCGGGTWTNIVTDEAVASNEFAWPTIPVGVKSETAFLRIQDARHPAQTCLVMPASFKIRPELDVTSPITSDNFTVNATVSEIIKWTQLRSATGVQYVDLFYTANASDPTPTWNAIPELISPAQVYENVPVASGTAGIPWKIPDAIGNDVQIKVVDHAVGYSAVLAKSDVFRIKGGLTLLGPQGDVSWMAGDTTKSVTWTKSGSVANIDIYYSTTGAAPWGTAIANLTGGETSFAWNPLPSVVTNTGAIRLVSDYTDNNLDIETIGSTFKIGAQFSVSQPEDGHTATITSSTDTYDITWTTPKGTGIEKVHLQYTNNGDSGSPTWINITDPTDVTGGIANISPYEWTIPRTYAALGSTMHKVRVLQHVPKNYDYSYDGTKLCESEGYFGVKAAVWVTSPVGSESWDANTQYSIKFKKRGVLNAAKLYYAANGTTFSKDITTTAAFACDAPLSVAAGSVDLTGLSDDAEGTCHWTIAADTELTSGVAGKLKIVPTDPSVQNAISGISNAIEVKGSLTVDTPTASNVALLYGGSNYDITWTPYGAITDVKLYYSTNGGANFASFPINNGNSIPVANTPYSWAIPDKIGNNLVIRVEDAGNDRVSDISNNPFEIYGSMTLDYPDNGVAYLYVDAPITILWTPTGTYPGSYRTDVQIHYSTDGASYPDPDNRINEKANPATGVQGTQGWNVPNAISADGTDNVMIRVRVKNS
ncbi:MAG: hypothetical protein AAB403_16080, partial [Planctomycetota bacterium]